MKSDLQQLQDFIRLGDRKAFGELYLRHLPRLYTAALRIVNDAHEAQDITQQAAVRALQAAAHYREECPVHHWLLRIVMNLAVDRRRKRAAAQRRLREQAAAPARESVDAQSLAALETCIADLEPALQAPIILHYYDKMSQAEIAVTLGCAQSTVSQRLKDGLAALRAMFERGGFAAFLPMLPNCLQSAGPAPLPPALAAGVLVAIRGASLTGGAAAAGLAGTAAFNGFTGLISHALALFMLLAAALSFTATVLFHRPLPEQDVLSPEFAAASDPEATRTAVMTGSPDTADHAAALPEEAPDPLDQYSLQTLLEGIQDLERRINKAKEETEEEEPRLVHIRKQYASLKRRKDEVKAPWISELLSGIRSRRAIANHEFESLRTYLAHNDQEWIDLYAKERDPMLRRVLLTANRVAGLEARWTVPVEKPVFLYGSTRSVASRVFDEKIVRDLLTPGNTEYRERLLMELTEPGLDFFSTLAGEKLITGVQAFCLDDNSGVNGELRALTLFQFPARQYEACELAVEHLSKAQRDGEGVTRHQFRLVELVFQYAGNEQIYLITRKLAKGSPTPQDFSLCWLRMLARHYTGPGASKSTGKRFEGNDRLQMRYALFQRISVARTLSDRACSLAAYASMGSEPATDAKVSLPTTEELLDKFGSHIVTSCYPDRAREWDLYVAAVKGGKKIHGIELLEWFGQ